MTSYEVTMSNNITGRNETCVVVSDSNQSSRDDWFEVFENESEHISDDDMPGNWTFKSSIPLECCNGCGGLRRPGPIGTGAVLS